MHQEDNIEEGDKMDHSDFIFGQDDNNKSSPHSTEHQA
jgi:hypothetical protein